MLELLNQPVDGQMGNILIEKMSEDKYKHFVIISAFAKNSGVLRLKESLKNFRDKNGTIEAFVGLTMLTFKAQYKRLVIPLHITYVKLETLIIFLLVDYQQIILHSPHI